jgi:hypothetical protein
MRRFVILWILTGLLPLKADETLKTYLWKKRPLLLFAPSARDKLYQEQLTRLHKDTAWKERDVVVLTSDTPTTAIRLREKFEISPSPFTAVLIGKDGEEKWRTTQNFTVTDLAQRIEAMPMGRDEARHRHKSPTGEADR